MRLALVKIEPLFPHPSALGRAKTKGLATCFSRARPFVMREKRKVLSWFKR